MAQSSIRIGGFNFFVHLSLSNRTGILNLNLNTVSFGVNGLPTHVYLIISTQPTSQNKHILRIWGHHTYIMGSRWCLIYAGGKGTVRRKVVRRTKASTAQDDKKLQTALKKLNVQPIPGVEEVNMFREDGNVLHFTAPKGLYWIPISTFTYNAGYYEMLITDNILFMCDFDMSCAHTWFDGTLFDVGYWVMLL